MRLTLGTRPAGGLRQVAAVLLAIVGWEGTGRQMPGEHVRIVLVGDSTVAEGGGWGPGFRAAFGPEVEVLNLALNGRSSKSFLDEGAWTRALATRPHYVLIQFGHNDNPGKGADRETDPTTTFRVNLTRYLDDTRAAGALPVLVTSIVRRNMTPDGKVQTDALVPYVEEVRRLGAARHVPVMDLYALTLAECEQLGRTGCDALGAVTSTGALDTTHLSPVGQREIGALAVREFVRVVLPAQASADPKTITAAMLLPLNRARTTFPMPEPKSTALPTLLIIGDSTVRHDQGDGAKGLWGWGEALAEFFDASRINVVNRAVSGLSSRTFLTLGHWDRALALIKRGDILLMQFGHNDAGALNDPTRARGTLRGTGDDVTTIDNLMTGEPEVVHTYGWYLRRFIEDARAKGSTVIVCSPVPRNTWKDGHVVRTEDYRQWAAEVARTNAAAFIDLNEIVAARYDALGAGAVAPFFPSDNTHTSRAGAELTAASVVAGLKALPSNPLAAYFSNRAKGDGHKDLGGPFAKNAKRPRRSLFQSCRSA
jgi:lysophospholipase L1-like esterase